VLAKWKSLSSGLADVLHPCDTVTFARSRSRRFSVAALLRAGGRGDLFASCYDDLRRVAHALFALERPGHTLQPTALLHEAYLRLQREKRGMLEDRAYFFASVAQAMRRILVEHARRKGRRRHGGGRKKLPLEAAGFESRSVDLDWLAVDDALTALALRNQRASVVAMLRLFAGLNADSTAEMVGVSVPTVNRDWMYARAWLNQHLGGGDRDDAD
jgi:RNA polymerase sigma-70 factor, ECF subfamily